MNLVRFLAAATIIAAGFAGPSVAQEFSGQVQRVEVRYADLNLTREADARRLLSRINGAARRNCQAPNRQNGLRISSRACRTQAVADTVRTINAPLLTAVYSGKTQTVLASK